MLSEGEKRIYSVLFEKKSGIHIREICRLANLSLPSVIKHIVKGEKEKIILCEQVGNQKICKLNFKNVKLVSMIQKTESEKFEALPYAIQNAINSFMNELIEKPLILLIFGSFAKNSYTKNSDLDVLLVFQRLDKKLIKNIEEFAVRIKGRTMVNIQPVSLSYGDFEKEILSRDNEFMKDIRKDSLILCGLDLYIKFIGVVYDGI